LLSSVRFACLLAARFVFVVEAAGAARGGGAFVVLRGAWGFPGLQCTAFAKKPMLLPKTIVVHAQ
jgi:hypothetical protein